MFGTILKDVRYALRRIGRSPGIALVIAVSIGLGIAANTTVFSVANGLLFGELPVREPDRLVSFNRSGTLPYADYIEYRKLDGVFEGVAAHFPLVPVSIGGGEPERIWGQMVSGNYFRVLGMDAILGRTIQEDEDRLRQPVVVLSHSLWKRRFGGDPAVIGKPAVLNNRTFTVVGVLPAGFHGEDRGLVAEFWMPLSFAKDLMPDLFEDDDKLFTTHTANWVMINGRLKPNVSREQAEAAVNVVKDRIDREFRPKQVGRKRMLLGKAGALMGEVAGFSIGLMTGMMVVVALVLLIACLNVANILLARATARQKEMGVRLAIGANRWHLVRQLLLESTMLAFLGAIVGTALTFAVTSAISQARFPLPLPIAFDFTPDWRVFGFAVAITIVTGILFGLAPALRSTRPDLAAAIKNEEPLAGSRKISLRGVLVVAQVTMSLVLLVCASLFLRSLWNASNIPLGMDVSNLLTVSFDLKSHGFAPEQSKQFLAQLRDRVSALPGVESVSYVDILPLSLGGHSRDYVTSPAQGSEEQQLNADVFGVGDDYFKTLGIPIRGGRAFERSRDGGRGAVVINEAAAAKLFPDGGAIGRQIRRRDGKEYLEVIGVAANAKSLRLEEDGRAIVYEYTETDPGRQMAFFGLVLLVKSAGPPRTVLAPVREEFRLIAPNLALFQIETMEEHLGKALIVPRLSAMLLGSFGLVGLALAMIGLYGVMAFLVQQRTREIGIRMALGASSGRILGGVMRHGMALSLVGVALGLLLSALTAQLFASFLYGMTPNDVPSFAVVTFLLLLIAALAIAVPASIAARVNPLVALRHD